jgi:uncharacterized membrane protein YphA (DoxX/SURF4 family)
LTALAQLTHFMTGLLGGVDARAMLAATIEVTSGLALALGFLTREFALLLVVFSLSAAAIGNRYRPTATPMRGGPNLYGSGRTSVLPESRSSSSREGVDDLKWRAKELG